jgi:tetratricopeptide (TPR) repeat protein
MKKILSKIIFPRKQWNSWSYKDRLEVIASWTVILNFIFWFFYATYKLIPNEPKIITKPLFITENFRVLILPFNQYGCSGNHDCGEIIAKRLNKLNRTDSLNLEVKYLPIKPSQNFDEDSARYLLTINKSDLIIYGSNYCTNEKDDQVCINYISNKNIALTNIKNNTGDELQQGNLIDLKNGKLLANIDFILYWTAGRTELLQEKYISAKRKFEYILKNIDNKNSDVIFLMGLINFRLKNFESAIKNFTEVIYYNPNNAESFSERGILKSYLKDTSGARSDMLIAIKLNPRDSISNRNLGILSKRLGKHKEAINYFDKTIKLNPFDILTYQYRGQLKFKMGDKLGAIYDYTEIIKLQKNNIDAYFNRAWIKFRLGDMEGAIQDYDKVIEFNPRNEIAYYHRGHIKFELGEIKSAMFDLDKAIEINSNYAPAYYYRGVVEESIGNLINACKDFKMAKKLYYKMDDAVINKICK